MLAVVAMISVQLGAAISVGLFDEIGVAGTAWIRITIGAIGFVLIARPRYWKWSRQELRAPFLLGIVSAGMTLCFLAAINLLPLGTAVAIEFLGPLTVATIHSHSRRALTWPALAHVGDRFAGVDGLAISMPVAAVVAMFVGLPQAWGHLTLEVLLVALGAAVLLPLIPWTLELYALRRLTKAAFGTLMALEPALALAIGILVLRQIPAGAQVVGMGCVVLAGVAAERTGHRQDELGVSA